MLAATADERRNIALAHLDTLLDIRDRGLREPLPLVCLASAAYARAASRGGSAERAARAQWDMRFHDGQRIPGEADHPEHQIVFGDRVAFEELLAQEPRSDESGMGWHPDEATRFGRYARRLWSGLLDDRREELIDR